MGVHDFDDLEARVDALSAHIDRQDKLLERITVSLYDVVNAVRTAGSAEPDDPHPAQPSPRHDEPVVDLVDYARTKERHQG